MSGKPRQAKAYVVLRLTSVSLAVFAVMEALEPLLFADEKYTAWRLIKISCSEAREAVFAVIRMLTPQRPLTPEVRRYVTQ